jgi:hypothetical protein
MDKGVGKTLTVLSFFELEKVHQNIPGFTIIVLTTEKGMQAYVRDLKLFPEWQGKISLVYGGKGLRATRWRNPTAKYFIVTYNSLLSDTGFRTNDRSAQVKSEVTVPSWVFRASAVDGVVADEFHRVLRRRDTATHKALKVLFKSVKWMFLLSGSAIGKGPEDIWAALNVLDPKLWSSYWNYVYTWCETADTGFGKQIIGPKMKNIANWRRATRPYLYHVEAAWCQDMPKLNRSFLDVELVGEQKRIHDSLLQTTLAELPDGEFLFSPNSLVKQQNVRLALICPKVLSPELGYGEGIEAIFDDAQESELTRYGIFTPFKAPIPHLKLYLEGRGARVWVVQGGIGYDEHQKREQAWRQSLNTASPQKPSIMLFTTKYGESWEIPEASYGYGLGYEFDPEDNKQAESRFCRLSSPAPVFIQYVRHLGAYDEEQITKLLDKVTNRRTTMRTVAG